MAVLRAETWGSPALGAPLHLGRLSQGLGTLCPVPPPVPLCHDATSDRMALGWQDRSLAPPAPPETGSHQSLPLPACHVGVSAGWEQSLHSQSVLQPSANKSIARSLEAHFPVFYLGFHCLCTCVNGANSSSMDTG